MYGFVISDPGPHTSGFKNLLGNSATARIQQNLQTVSSPAQITNEILKGISSNPLPGRDWVAQHRDALNKADFSKLTMLIKIGSYDVNIVANHKLKDMKVAIASIKEKR
jgi:hypothetical protein